MKRLLLALLILLLLAPAPASARTFYITPGGGTPIGTGCDAGKCTTGSRCRYWKDVLTQCESVLETGGPHTVIITDGTYDEGDFLWTAVSEAALGTSSTCSEWTDTDPFGGRGTQALNYFPSTFTPDGGLTFRCETLPDSIDSADDLIQNDDRIEHCTFAIEEPYDTDWLDYVPFVVLSDDIAVQGFHLNFPLMGLAACSVSDFLLEDMEIECNGLSNMNCVMLANIDNGGVADINGSKSIPNWSGLEGTKHGAWVEDVAIRPRNNEPWQLLDTLGGNNYRDLSTSTILYVKGTHGAMLYKSFFLLSGQYGFRIEANTSPARLTKDFNVIQSRTEGWKQHGGSHANVWDGEDTDAVCGEASVCWGSSMIVNTIRGRCWDPSHSSPQDTFTNKFCHGATQGAADAMCSGETWAFAGDSGNSTTCRRNDSYCLRKDNNAEWPIGSCNSTTADCGTANGDGICGMAIGAKVSVTADLDSTTGIDTTCGGEITAGMLGTTGKRCDWNHDIVCTSNAHCISLGQTDGNNQLTMRGGRVFEWEGALGGPAVFVGSNIIPHGNGIQAIWKPSNNGGDGDFILAQTRDYADQWGARVPEGQQGICLLDTEISDCTSGQSNGCDTAGAASCNPDSPTCGAGRTCQQKSIIEGVVWANNIIGDNSMASAYLLLPIPTNEDHGHEWPNTFFEYTLYTQGSSHGDDIFSWDGDDEFRGGAGYIQVGTPRIATGFWRSDQGSALKANCYASTAGWPRTKFLVPPASGDNGPDENGSLCTFNGACSNGGVCPDNDGAFKGLNWYGRTMCDAVNDGNFTNHSTNDCTYKNHLLGDFIDYNGGDYTPVSASAVMVDAGSDLDTTWRGVQLCPPVDYNGDVRGGSACDQGAIEYTTPAVSEVCDDASDNDSDGCTDCPDPDCFDDAVCTTIPAEGIVDTCADFDKAWNTIYGDDGNPCLGGPWSGAQVTSSYDPDGDFGAAFAFDCAWHLDMMRMIADVCPSYAAEYISRGTDIVNHMVAKRDVQREADSDPTYDRIGLPPGGNDYYDADYGTFCANEDAPGWRRRFGEGFRVQPVTDGMICSAILRFTQFTETDSRFAAYRAPNPVWLAACEDVLDGWSSDFMVDRYSGGADPQRPGGTSPEGVYYLARNTRCNGHYNYSQPSNFQTLLIEAAMLYQRITGSVKYETEITNLLAYHRRIFENDYGTDFFNWEYDPRDNQRHNDINHAAFEISAYRTAYDDGRLPLSFMQSLLGAANRILKPECGDLWRVVDGTDNVTTDASGGPWPYTMADQWLLALHGIPGLTYPTDEAKAAWLEAESPYTYPDWTRELFPAAALIWVAATPEVCDSVGDEDSDGYADCADSDCFPGTGPSGETCELPDELSCTDGFDNDNDGDTDCDDSDCTTFPACIAPGAPGSLDGGVTTKGGGIGS